MPFLTQNIFVDQVRIIKRSSPVFELYLRGFKKSLTTLIGPAAILLAAAWILSREISLHPAFLDLFHYVPYLFLGAGLALSWRFSQGRSFFLIVILAISYWSLDTIARNLDSADITAMSVYAGVCFLLPINFVAFSLSKEQGVFSKHNIVRYIMVLMQIAIVGIFANLESDTYVRPLFIKFDSTGLLAHSKLPEIAQIIFLLALFVLAIRLFMNRSALAGGVIGALIAMGLSLNYELGGLESILYASIASFILMLAVVQDSYILAYHDDLTGLPGRRALNEQMMKLGGKYVMAMVDVDHFKKFNDKYGHHIGDQVLRFVAAKLEAVRGGGKVYRYGGEEFTILFQGKESPDVIDYLEQVHTAIGEAEFVVRSKDRPKKRPEQKPPSKKTLLTVKVTVSVGVAGKTDRRPTPQHVLKAADRSLYQAKRAGRNQIWM
ncbi:MAG: GGDEF domain-containing protein [Gammaproteobacteria bacterium]|nr:MAG: GGDEF domain-containing protein [Gammaproteobacteria bacterium]